VELLDVYLMQAGKAAAYYVDLRVVVRPATAPRTR
jgi:hypothetical protein